MSLKKFFSRSRLGLGHTENDLDDEMRFHLEKEIEQNLASGMSATEARRRALVAFGGVQQARESVKRVYWIHWWEILLNDARYGLRMLRKSPAFSVAAVMILALGIGMNSAIFSLIDAVLFRTLPGKDPQNLVLLRWHARGSFKHLSYSDYGDCPRNAEGNQNRSGCSFSSPFFRAAQSRTDLFSDLAGFAGAPRIALSGNGPATILNSAMFVSGNYFQTVGIPAAIGRTLAPADDTPSSSPVLMLSYGYWQNAFGSDANVVGRAVRLNGTSFTIVGVAQHGFEGLTPGNRVDLWMPFAARPSLDPRWKPSNDGENYWWAVIVGRLRPGVSMQQAQTAASLPFRNQVLNGEKPVLQAQDDPGIFVISAQQGLQGQRKQILEPLYVMLLAVGVILLVACANVAGLLLARASSREKEIAVRLTLGARRGRVLIQLLMESLILALTGGAAGLVLAYWGARGIVAMVVKASGGEGPNISSELDLRVLLFTAAVSILTGIVFGLLPAFRSLRLDLTPALKTGSAGSSAGSSRHRWYSMGNSLVVAQVGLAMIALVVAGLLVRSLTTLKTVELGFQPRNVLLFGMNPTLAGYKNNQIDVLYRDLQEQFAGLPGVTSVSYSWRPLLGGGLWTEGFHAPGTPEHEEADTDYLPVGPGFFKTMGIAMKAGRDFTLQDFQISAAIIAASQMEDAKPSSVPIPILVNETFVHRYFPSVNPVGQHVEDMPSDDPKKPRGAGWEIIGVVQDAKYNQLRREINPTMYAPYSGGDAFFEIRAQGDPTQLVPAVRDILNRRDSNLALFRISTQTERIEAVLVQDRLLAQLASFFGALALLLACTGLYGLLSYEVARRTREIGIRMAVGAQRQNVIGMVVMQAFALALAGAVIGIAASLGVARLLQSMLYGIGASDPLTLAGVASLLLAVVLAACFLPARRATRIDPLVALRYE